MAMRFRKSVNLGGKTKLNLNKKSASVSFGPKGMRTTISTSGRTTHTTSIPGTGVSYSTTTGTKSKQRKKDVHMDWTQPQRKEPAAPTQEQMAKIAKVQKVSYKVLAILMVMIAAMLMLLSLVYGVVCVIGAVVCGWLAVKCWKKKTEVPESEE